jgi:hypothetical protein
MLDRDSILASDDLPRQEVDVPEWGGSIWIRGMSGVERDSFDLAMAADRKANKVANIRAQLLVRTLCDDHGKRLFDDAAATALGNKAGAVLDRLYDIAAALSGVGVQAEKEAAKN